MPVHPLFLRSYTAHITLIALEGDHVLEQDQWTALEHAGFKHRRVSARFTFRTTDPLSSGMGTESFDTLHPALGSDVRSDLAKQVGAAVTDEGCLTVDAHQRTSIPYLYGAGDVVLGLDQISHAMGEGGVAATTIRDDLSLLRPLYR